MGLAVFKKKSGVMSLGPGLMGPGLMGPGLMGLDLIFYKNGHA